MICQERDDMAGHSKWKNIQHRKGAQDAKRGKVFTKIAVEITVATRRGGGSPADNPSLRTALAKAKAANMPKDNCDRAIKKGLGETGADTYSEKTYEGYGPGGVAVLVECLTDNVNRTVSNMRFAFTRSGGNLGTDGSVAWMFKRKGVLVYDRKEVGNLEALCEVAMEHGADDLIEEEESLEIHCAPEMFHELQTKVLEVAPNPLAAELSYIPDTMQELGADKTQSLMKLIDALEDDDDVQNVYHNANLDT
jgi:YebC/PmpR family DNA-binding regulatory protein